MKKSAAFCSTFHSTKTLKIINYELIATKQQYSTPKEFIYSEKIILTVI